jgi:heterodisulfide reductase subunit A-like polyferredoxin
VKKLPRPVDVYASNFYSEVDSELCTGCGICVDNCQLGAPVLNDGTVTINLDRCIGCGNCVVSCPSNAVRLRKKDSQQSLAKDLPGVYTRMLKKKVGNLGILKVAAKALLKQKV